MLCNRRIVNTKSFILEWLMLRGYQGYFEERIKTFHLFSNNITKGLMLFLQFLIAKSIVMEIFKKHVLQSQWT